MWRFNQLVFGIVVAFATSSARAQEREPTTAEAPERSSPALEQNQATPRLVGSFPEPAPTVTVELEDESIADALAEIARQAGWSLVLAASSAALEQEVTLRVRERPATELLDVVLDAGDLEARLNGGTLVVKSRAGDSRGFGTIELPMGDLRVRIKAGDGGELGDRHVGFKHRKANKDDRVVVGSNGEVGADETVADAVAVGGSMRVKGHVRGDAVAVGGSVVLEPGATVDGDAVAVGGRVDVADGATLKGDRVGIGGSLGGLITSLASLGSPQAMVPAAVFGVLSTLLRAIVLLVLGLLLLAFMPERIDSVRSCLTARPGHSVLAGFGLLFGFLPLCLLLVITVVGIPLVPVAAVLLAVVLVVGFTAFAVWLGYQIPLFTAKKTPVVAMLIGLALCTLVDLVPVVGTALLTFVAFVAAGAVLLSRFGRPRAVAVTPAV